MWLRGAAVLTPIGMLAYFFSLTTVVEPLAIHTHLLVAMLGAFLPVAALASVVTLLVVGWAQQSALVAAMGVAVLILVLWRLTTAVDRVITVMLLGPTLAYVGGGLATPWWAWLVGAVGLVLVMSRRPLLQAVDRARHPGMVDRQPSRSLTPDTSDDLARAGWPLVVAVDDHYLHSSPLPGTYAVATKAIVFLTTRFGQRSLVTTNGAPIDLPWELVQRVPSRPAVDVLLATHERGLGLVEPRAGSPQLGDGDLVDVYREDLLREAEVIESSSWRLTVRLLGSLMRRQDLPLKADDDRIARWLEAEVGSA